MTLVQSTVRLILIACAVCLTGCAGLVPTPVSFPVKTGSIYDYSAYIGPKPADSMNDLIDQVEAYRGAWTKTRDGLSQEIDFGSHTVFAGAITAAIATVRKSGQGQTIGALLAGAGSLIPSHLELPKQKANYTKAVESVTCISYELTKVSSKIWPNLFDGSGNFKLQPSTPDAAKLQAIPGSIRSALAKIATALDKAQNTVEFTTPDKDAVVAAFQKYAVAKAEAPAAAIGMVNLATGMFHAMDESNNVFKVSQYDLQALLVMSAAIDACAVSP